MPKFLAAAARGVRAAVESASISYVATVKKKVRSYGGGERTMELASSISHEIVPYAGRIAGYVGTSMIYGKIHETGGTITPKNREYLAIPLNYAARRLARDTVSPISAPDRHLVPKSLYYSPVPLVCIRTKRGNLVLIAKDKNKKRGDAKISPGDLLFALKKMVNYPARPYLRPSIREGYPAALAAARVGMTREIARALK